MSSIFAKFIRGSLRVRRRFLHTQGDDGTCTKPAHGTVGATEGSSASIRFEYDYMDVSLTTTSLVPGDIYSCWLLFFEKTDTCTGCAEIGGDDNAWMPCEPSVMSEMSVASEDDDEWHHCGAEDNAEVGTVINYGGVVGTHDTDVCSGKLFYDEYPVGYGRTRIKGGYPTAEPMEIHVVVRNHGPQQAKFTSTSPDWSAFDVDMQKYTHDGGCDTGPNVFGILGDEDTAFTCCDPVQAIFQWPTY